MAIRIVRLGQKRERGEGVRIGTVRRPPRGVPASRFAKDDWYDVWYPELSPSAALVAKALHSEDDKTWNAPKFFRLGAITLFIAVSLIYAMSTTTGCSLQIVP